MVFGKAVILVRKQIRAALKQMVTWMAFIRIIYVSQTLRLKNMTIVNNAANTTDNVDRMQDVIKNPSWSKKLRSPMPLSKVQAVQSI